MKKWVVFFIIILFLTFIGINEQIIVRNTLIEVKNKIVTIQNDYKNNKGNEQEALDIKNDWLDKRKYLEYFMMHTELNVINQRMDEMIACLQTQDYDLAYTQACVLVGILENMPEMLVPSFANIF